jgi:predicted metalloprotease with PDZ domain
MSSALLMAPEEMVIEGVRFELPEGWGIEAPWPEREPGVFVPPSRVALVNDLIAVGAWSVERSQAGGVDLSVAFAPGQERLKELLAKDLTRIVGAELELFGIQPHRRYLLLFGRPEMPSFCGGSPKTGSMTLAVSEDLPVEFSGPAILHLVAHEYHHTWMMARCQPAHELRFVMEGFTDWFAYRVLDQLELQPAAALEETLLKKLVLGEQALAEFGGSLATAGGPPFFSGGAPYDACYAAGLGLAAWTEVALKRAGSGWDLAEFLRRIYNDPRWLAGEQPQLADFFDLLRQALGARAEAWVPAVERAVTVPGGLDWVALFGLLELSLERAERPLDATPRANFEGTTVTALDPAGAAGCLGLQAGDRLLEVQGQGVSDAAAIRSLWRADGAGQIALKFERAGQVLEIRAPYPQVKVLRLAGQQPSPFLRAAPGSEPQ